MKENEATTTFTEEQIKTLLAKGFRISEDKMRATSAPLDKLEGHHHTVIAIVRNLKVLGFKAKSSLGIISVRA